MEPPPCQPPPPPPHPEPEVVCNCLQVQNLLQGDKDDLIILSKRFFPQICPESSPPCPSQPEPAPLLLHQLHKRQAADEQIDTEPSSPDSGLTDSTSSSDPDITKRDPNSELFNGSGPYPAGLPYLPSSFGQSIPFTPYGRSPYLGFGGYPSFGRYPIGSQPFLGGYRGHPFHRGPHPGGYHARY